MGASRPLARPGSSNTNPANSCSSSLEGMFHEVKSTEASIGDLRARLIHVNGVEVAGVWSNGPRGTVASRAEEVTNKVRLRLSQDAPDL